ncbi:hypothetical protein HMPREF1214_00482 [Bacteroides sp. HPS0048]|nr:hypothetical protein HMPREF1214_00482 [Bacteroides sp. HPS0048]
MKQKDPFKNLMNQINLNALFLTMNFQNGII